MNRVSHEERSVFWEVIISVSLYKKVYVYMCHSLKVSEIEPFHCTVVQSPAVVATRHVLTWVAKCIGVDSGIFENVLY
jgi:hypothetical protein